jgi:pyrroline-5-carboxylate reductase
MPKVLFVGAGNMGSALLRSAIKNGVLLPAETFVLESSPEKSDLLQKELGVQMGNPEDAEVIILAVKPQSFESVFPLRSATDSLIISVMAGISSQKIIQVSGKKNVCRVMPNTPALVGEGMSGIFFSPSVDEAQKAFCRRFFSAAGKVIEVLDEDRMHSVTAVSGSGPAYFFRFVECLQAAAQKQGLSADSARILAEQTFIGSACLLQGSNENALSLREKVTSPGGTTEAALKTFSELDLENIVLEAVESAKKRSRELGSE